jgi:hypothetical protein
MQAQEALLTALDRAILAPQCGLSSLLFPAEAFAITSAAKAKVFARRI